MHTTPGREGSHLGVAMSLRYHVRQLYKAGPFLEVDAEFLNWVPPPGGSSPTAHADPVDRFWIHASLLSGDDLEVAHVKLARQWLLHAAHNHKLDLLPGVQQAEGRRNDVAVAPTVPEAAPAPVTAAAWEKAGRRASRRSKGRAPSEAVDKEPEDGDEVAATHPTRALEHDHHVVEALMAVPERLLARFAGGSDLIDDLRSLRNNPGFQGDARLCGYDASERGNLDREPAEVLRGAELKDYETTLPILRPRLERVAFVAQGKVQRNLGVLLTMDGTIRRVDKSSPFYNHPRITVGCRLLALHLDAVLRVPLETDLMHPNSAERGWAAHLGDVFLDSLPDWVLRGGLDVEYIPGMQFHRTLVRVHVPARINFRQWPSTPAAAAAALPEVYPMSHDGGASRSGGSPAAASSSSPAARTEAAVEEDQHDATRGSSAHAAQGQRVPAASQLEWESHPVYGVVPSFKLRNALSVFKESDSDFVGTVVGAHYECVDAAPEAEDDGFCDVEGKGSTEDSFDHIAASCERAPRDRRFSGAGGGTFRDHPVEGHARTCRSKVLHYKVRVDAMLYMMDGHSPVMWSSPHHGLLRGAYVLVNEKHVTAIRTPRWNERWHWERPGGGPNDTHDIRLEIPETGAAWPDSLSARYWWSAGIIKDMGIKVYAVSDYIGMHDYKHDRAFRDSRPDRYKQELILTSPALLTDPLLMNIGAYGERMADEWLESHALAIVHCIHERAKAHANPTVVQRNSGLVLTEDLLEVVKTHVYEPKKQEGNEELRRRGGIVPKYPVGVIGGGDHAEQTSVPQAQTTLKTFSELHDVARVLSVGAPEGVPGSLKSILLPTTVDGSEERRVAWRLAYSAQYLRTIGTGFLLSLVRILVEQIYQLTQTNDGRQWQFALEFSKTVQDYTASQRRGAQLSAEMVGSKSWKKQGTTSASPLANAARRKVVQRHYDRGVPAYLVAKPFSVWSKMSAEDQAQARVEFFERAWDIMISQHMQQHNHVVAQMAVQEKSSAFRHLMQGVDHLMLRPLIEDRPWLLHLPATSTAANDPAVHVEEAQQKADRHQAAAPAAPTLASSPLGPDLNLLLTERLPDVRAWLDRFFYSDWTADAGKAQSWFSVALPVDQKIKAKYGDAENFYQKVFSASWDLRVTAWGLAKHIIDRGAYSPHFAERKGAQARAEMQECWNYMQGKQNAPPDGTGVQEKLRRCLWILPRLADQRAPGQDPPPDERRDQEPVRVPLLSLEQRLQESIVADEGRTHAAFPDRVQLHVPSHLVVAEDWHPDGSGTSSSVWVTHAFRGFTTLTKSTGFQLLHVPSNEHLRDLFRAAGGLDGLFPNNFGYKWQPDTPASSSHHPLQEEDLLSRHVRFGPVVGCVFVSRTLAKAIVAQVTALRVDGKIWSEAARSILNGGLEATSGAAAERPWLRVPLDVSRSLMRAWYEKNKFAGKGERDSEDPDVLLRNKKMSDYIPTESSPRAEVEVSGLVPKQRYEVKIYAHLKKSPDETGISPANRALKDEERRVGYAYAADQEDRTLSALRRFVEHFDLASGEPREPRPASPQGRGGRSYTAPMDVDAGAPPEPSCRSFDDWIALFLKENADGRHFALRSPVTTPYLEDAGATARWAQIARMLSLSPAGEWLFQAHDKAQMELAAAQADPSTSGEGPLWSQLLQLVYAQLAAGLLTRQQSLPMQVDAAAAVEYEKARKRGGNKQALRKLDPAQAEASAPRSSYYYATKGAGLSKDQHLAQQKRSFMIYFARKYFLRGPGQGPGSDPDRLGGSSGVSEPEALMQAGDAWVQWTASPDGSLSSFELPTRLQPDRPLEPALVLTAWADAAGRMQLKIRLPDVNRFGPKFAAHNGVADFFALTGVKVRHLPSEEQFVAAAPGRSSDPVSSSLAMKLHRTHSSIAEFLGPGLRAVVRAARERLASHGGVSVDFDDDLDQRQQSASASSGGSSSLGDAVEVSSVDAFQGREKKVIIVEVSRTRPWGLKSVRDFLNNESRLNVAITRAKNLVIVVCDVLGLAGTKDLHVPRAGAGQKQEQVPTRNEPAQNNNVWHAFLDHYDNHPEVVNRFGPFTPTSWQPHRLVLPLWYEMTDEAQLQGNAPKTASPGGPRGEHASSPSAAGEAGAAASATTELPDAHPGRRIDGQPATLQHRIDARPPPPAHSPPPPPPGGVATLVGPPPGLVGETGPVGPEGHLHISGEPATVPQNPVVGVPSNPPPSHPPRISPLPIESLPPWARHRYGGMLSSPPPVLPPGISPERQVADLQESAKGSAVRVKSIVDAMAELAVTDTSHAARQAASNDSSPRGNLGSDDHARVGDEVHAGKPLSLPASVSNSISGRKNLRNSPAPLQSPIAEQAGGLRVEAPFFSGDVPDRPASGSGASDFSVWKTTNPDSRGSALSGDANWGPTLSQASSCPGRRRKRKDLQRVSPPAPPPIAGLPADDEEANAGQPGSAGGESGDERVVLMNNGPVMKDVLGVWDDRPAAPPRESAGGAASNPTEFPPLMSPFLGSKQGRKGSQTTPATATVAQSSKSVDDLMLEQEHEGTPEQSVDESASAPGASSNDLGNGSVDDPELQLPDRQTSKDSVSILSDPMSPQNTGGHPFRPPPGLSLPDPASDSDDTADDPFEPAPETPAQTQPPESTPAPQTRSAGPESGSSGAHSAQSWATARSGRSTAQEGTGHADESWMRTRLNARPKKAAHGTSAGSTPAAGEAQIVAPVYFIPGSIPDGPLDPTSPQAYQAQMPNMGGAAEIGPYTNWGVSPQQGWGNAFPYAVPPHPMMQMHGGWGQSAFFGGPPQNPSQQISEAGSHGKGKGKGSRDRRYQAGQGSRADRKGRK
ncbi:unnamed protein product [Amoebophrya sp. A120]|nr:unnamed protein product [Amoebophrya sp. A120]|eukprot:GSA120T00002891001.1